MEQLADYALIRLPGALVNEIQGVQPGVSLDSFVREAVRSYIATGQRRKLQKQLAQDYDDLAAMYAELADEAWLPAENAALLQTEKARAS